MENMFIVYKKTIGRVILDNCKNQTFVVPESLTTSKKSNVELK